MNALTDFLSSFAKSFGYSFGFVLALCIGIRLTVPVFVDVCKKAFNALIEDTIYKRTQR